MRTGFRWSLALGIALAAVTQSPAHTQQPTRRIIPLVRVRVTLQTTLDAKKARQGEPVRAKLEQDVPIPNGPTIPRNTILEGHVDQVQPSADHSNSTLVITFDRAKLRKGEPLPVKVTVLSVFEAATSITPQRTPVQAPEEAGGALGDTGTDRPGNFVPPPGSLRPPAPESQTTQAPQYETVQSHMQGVPGVTLRSNVNLSSSATFLSQGRNLRVPAGTQMEVAVGVMPKP